MRKDLGVMPAIFPMPVLMIATYDNDGNIDIMNAAWGTMLDTNKVALNLTESHKTVKNIKKKKAFTVSIANLEYMKEADYVGIVSGNIVKDKFAKTGLTSSKSNFVDAPIINEFPVTMECKFIEYQSDEYGIGVIGEIVNVSAKEEVLDSNGKINPEKIHALIYDPFRHGYYQVGEKVGDAFSCGKEIK